MLVHACEDYSTPHPVYDLEYFRYEPAKFGTTFSYQTGLQPIRSFKSRASRCERKVGKVLCFNNESYPTPSYLLIARMHSVSLDHDYLMQ